MDRISLENNPFLSAHCLKLNFFCWWYWSSWVDVTISLLSPDMIFDPFATSVTSAPVLHVQSHNHSDDTRRLLSIKSSWLRRIASKTDIGDWSPVPFISGLHGDTGLMLLEWAADPMAVDCPLSLLASWSNLSTDFNPLAIASVKLVLICPSRIDFCCWCDSFDGCVISFVTSTQDPRDNNEVNCEISNSVQQEMGTKTCI